MQDVAQLRSGLTLNPTRRGNAELVDKELQYVVTLLCRGVAASRGFMTRYLSLDDLLRIADAAAGVEVVVRDVGLLELGLGRPRATVFGEDAYPDIHTKAAALPHSLARNHALVDGNKRLAWAGRGSVPRHQRGSGERRQRRGRRARSRGRDRGTG